MINMIELSFTPKAIAWIYKRGESQALIAVSDADSSDVHVFDGRGEGSSLFTVQKLHSHPVSIIKYNRHHDCVVSVDVSGMVEYWEPTSTFQPPASIQWAFKSDTDLYEFVKTRTVPSSLEFSPDGSMFVTFGLGDRQLRVFKFATGKLIRKYTESLDFYTKMQQSETSLSPLEDMEFGRRLAMERELEKSDQAADANAVFDESGHLILVAGLLGVKAINIVTHKTTLIGRGDTVRLVNLALYQGIPKKKAAVTLVRFGV
jgi:peptidylprolyl isomerase domain and WD repeat-containing protein 1